MNIQEIKEKGKQLVLDDTAFFGVLILLIGLASFGLGRFSVQPAKETQAAHVHMVRSAESETAAARPKETRFVGSVNSDKYHAEYCTSAARIAETNRIWFDSEDEAQAAGYSRAGNCEFY